MKRYFYLLVFIMAGAILAQSFQCASRELTTAKVKFKSAEYEESKKYVMKELEKNPNSEEGLLLLARIHDRLREVKEMANVLVRAEKIVKNKKNIEEIARLKNHLWVNAYNVGINHFNNYITSKDIKQIDSAIYNYDIAIQVMPDMADFYNLKGVALEYKGDTAAAVNSYMKYVDLYADDIEVFKKYHIYSDQPRDEAIKDLGTPENTYGRRPTPEADSVQIDKFMVDGKELYLFFFAKPGEKLYLKGWLYNPPANWSDAEKERPYVFQPGPYRALSQIYYDQQKYDKAKNIVKALLVIEPHNSQANGFLIQIYNVQGKDDEALKTVREATEREPDNKVYRAQYGDLLLVMQRYDDAIAQYKKALEIDNHYALAARNLASALKNKAKIIQNKQLDSADKNDKYEPDPEEYFPYLRESAAYFELAREDSQFKDDINVLSELINIYEVLNNKNKVNLYLDDLEQLEFVIDESQKVFYYKTMCQVYTRLKNKEKRQEYCGKWQELEN